MAVDIEKAISGAITSVVANSVTKTKPMKINISGHAEDN